MGLNTAARTCKRYRAEIRAMFGYREATVADAEMLSEWLRDQAAVAGGVPEHLDALLNAGCRELLIEPPSTDRADRIVRAAMHAHDERFCATILGRLTPTMRARLEALLRPAWTVLVSKALRPNHHRRGANDGDGAGTCSGTDYRSSNIGDSNADNSPLNISDKGRNKRVRQIYQNNRQPLLCEARKPRAQALTTLGDDCFIKINCESFDAARSVPIWFC